ncbi:MAG: hypothetical protein HOB84_09070 [Candidatus Marinimicrobia bacterium]|jgi:hypothetical protein|nr:hypothetical protein [Candidatus Neomarinimicrobiota bacterium]MBT4360025.1 hypothetical protein [Candidatus Neomarinimicrobiota bacterium]MBT4714912.1 hypothetical protein [Candidatus Neomarinimicrobiota bacterium]MBT4945687.1 hypothetical protein [Candidatus Neomarinimicrobiota bacterium]MBT5269284.1 hypothetical protein [Candidatus Neomarinimicrobiota bacterium]
MGNPITGVWKVQTVTYKSGEQVTSIDPALPGLFIFTEAHYSMTWMPGGVQQADYKDLWHPNDEEKVQSYNSLVTNTGRYELSGSRLTTCVDVAKTPAFVGGKAVYECNIDGDDMRLEIKNNVAHDGTQDAGYLKFNTVLSLKRVE